MIVLGYILAVLYGFICIFLGSLAQKLGCPQPYCRKIVHITVGMEWPILYVFMGNTVHFFLVCVSFFLLLYIAYGKKWFSSMASDGENAPGTVYYALSMSVMSFISLLVPAFFLPFGAAVFCTSFGDGLGGVVGQAVSVANPKLFRQKTLLGTLTVGVVSFLCLYLFSLVFSLPLSLPLCLLIAYLVSAAELFSGKGTDNITVPLLCSGLVYTVLIFGAPTSYLLPLLLTPLLVYFALRKEALTPNAIVTAVAVDILISVCIGNGGFWILFLFFAGGVGCDAVHREKKKAILSDVEQKGSCRDSVQVLANSALAVLCAILYAVFARPLYIVLFLTVFAEALGDTAASGIGVLSSKTVDLFRGKRCEAGISGGMSLIGTASALLGAFLIAGAGVLVFHLPLSYILGIGCAGFLGTVADSLCGSLWQLKYRCPVCDKMTERHTHCGVGTERVGGLVPFDNDFVNFLSTFLSAVFSVLIFSFLY